MTIQDTIRKIEAIRDLTNDERKASDGVFHLDGAVSLDDIIKTLQDDGHDVVAYEIAPEPLLGNDGYLVEVHVDDHLLHVGEWSVWHGGKHAGFRHHFFAWTGETADIRRDMQAVDAIAKA